MVDQKSLTEIFDGIAEILKENSWLGEAGIVLDAKAKKTVELARSILNEIVKSCTDLADQKVINLLKKVNGLGHCLQVIDQAINPVCEQ